MSQRVFRSTPIAILLATAALGGCHANSAQNGGVTIALDHPAHQVMDALAMLGTHGDNNSMLPMTDITLGASQPDANTLMITVPGDSGHKPIIFTMVTTATDSQNTALYVTSDMAADLSLDDGQAHRITPDKVNEMLNIELGGMARQLDRGASPGDASASLHMVLRMIATYNNDEARAKWQHIAANPRDYGREVGNRYANRYLDTALDGQHLTDAQREKIRESAQNFASSASTRAGTMAPPLPMTAPSAPENPTNPWAK